MKKNEHLVSRGNEAFTLVELLLVIMMMSVLSLTLYATLSKGIDIWKRSFAQDQLEDLDLFFEKYAFDVRNAFSFRTISFAGKEDELAFATLVPTVPLKAQSVGKVVYRFDQRNDALIREHYNYSQLYEQNEEGAHEALKNVASVQFLYYSFDKTKQEYAWTKEWLQEGLPLAVSVGIRLKSKGDQGDYVRTVSIPAHL